MARRMDYSKRMTQNAGTGDRESIGDEYVHAACRDIELAGRAHAASAVPWQPTFDTIIHMLFSDDTRSKALAAKEIIEPRFYTLPYRNLGVAGVILTLDYEESGWPPINESVLSLQPGAGRLLNVVEEIRAIYLKYEQVKYVLRWMNRNATPGAIRHYWPTALQLCKKSAPLQEVAGGASRYAEPPEIGDLLQDIRDTAATWAAATMMPNTMAPRDRTNIRLTFSSVPIKLGNTDSVVYNL